MRLAFDLDGVLADFHGTLVREANARFPNTDSTTAAATASPAARGVDIDGDADSEDFPLPPRQQEQLWEALAAVPNFWETLSEIEPGVIGRLAALARERRWEVIFLTSRPDTAGDSIQVQTQRWLQQRGFPLPSVFVVCRDRGKIAMALDLDVVVDDRPKSCLDVALESKARAILVWRGAPGAVPASARRLGIGVVPTMAECLDVLSEVQQEGPDDTRWIDRLKRLLGLSVAAPSTRRLDVGGS
jgi:hypothetical protein